MRCLLTLLLLCNIASAQVSGYLGRRLNVEMNTFYSPTYLVFENKDELEYNNATRFKFNLQFALNYSISKRMELTFKYRRGADFVEYANWMETIVGGVVTDFRFTKEFDDQPLNYQYFDIGVHLFTRPFIAPVGCYHELNIGIVQFCHPEQNIDGGYYYEYAPVYDSTYGFWDNTWERAPVNVQKKGYHYRVGYSISHKKVLTNRLMFHYTFLANWHIRKFGMESWGSTISIREAEEEILNSVAIRYKRWTDIFTIKLGLSYSLF